MNELILCLNIWVRYIKEIKMKQNIKSNNIILINK